MGSALTSSVEFHMVTDIRFVIISFSLIKLLKLVVKYRCVLSAANNDSVEMTGNANDYKLHGSLTYSVEKLNFVWDYVW